MGQLKTTNIRGKDYVEVNERLKAFRTEPIYKGWQLVDEIIRLDDSTCIILSKVYNAEGVLVGTGLASEDRYSSSINKTSYVENCETSAWGRALGNIGIGIDSSICTAQELTVALAAQDQTTKQQTASNVGKQEQATGGTGKAPQPKGNVEPAHEIPDVDKMDEKTFEEYVEKLRLAWSSNAAFKKDVIDHVGKVTGWSAEDTKKAVKFYVTRYAN